jgi:phosphoribosyl-AMP cyclohydrolase
MKVEPGGDGGACHTGRRSCFYRKLASGPERVSLVFDESAEAQRASQRKTPPR